MPHLEKWERSELAEGESAVDDAIQITPYEDWMLDQVVALFDEQYGASERSEVRLSKDDFLRFYDAGYQRERAIRLVALDGDTVCGFQAYFYWPYTLRGQHLDSFQSGNSLVSSEYRGRRIFARLLNYIYEQDETPDIHFITGYPIEQSVGSLLRNGWVNPLDLVWHVRPVGMLSFLPARQPVTADYTLDRSPQDFEGWVPEEMFCLTRSAEFAEWRRGRRRSDVDYFYFHHARASDLVRFFLKPRRRGRYNELVIGEIQRSSGDPALLDEAIRELIRAVRGHGFIAFLSIAINLVASDPSLRSALRRNLFVRTNRTIYFLVKAVNPPKGYERPENWQLLVGDTDTW